MKTLKKFEFKGRAEAIYDWAKLLDGGIYQLDSGEDFECKIGTMMMLVRTRARKNGKTVQVTKTEDGNGIVLQAHVASDEQLEAWKTQDAARKVRNAAKRAAGQPEETEEEAETETETEEEAVEEEAPPAPPAKPAPKKNGKK